MKFCLTSFLSSRSQSALSYTLKNLLSSSSKSASRSTIPVPHFSSKGRQLYKRISPTGDPNISVVPVLDKWIEEGNPTKIEDIQLIIKQLNFYKRFKHALEVSLWMTDKISIAPSIDDVSLRLRLICNVHGLEQAEKYFKSIPQELKCHHAYYCLLNCYCNSKSIEKAESIMQNIRDLGYNRKPMCYTMLMRLYYLLGDYEKLDHLVQEMEQNNIVPDKFVYTIQLSAFAVVSDSDRMDKIVKKMESDPRVAMDADAYSIAASLYVKLRLPEKALDLLQKLEGIMSTMPTMGKSDPYDTMIELYGGIGKKDDVFRIWNSHKKKHKILNKGYISMVKALMRLNEFEEVEKIVKEWELKARHYDFGVTNFLIEVYCKKGEIDKAEASLNNGIARGGKPRCDTWLILAGAYVKDNQYVKMIEALENAKSVCPDDWKSAKDMIVNYLEIFGRDGGIERAENEDLLKLVKLEGFYYTKVGDKVRDFLEIE